VFVSQKTMFAPIIRITALCALCAAFLVSAAGLSPARADAEDVIRQIQRDGVAHIIVRMKIDTGEATWSAKQPALKQKAAVAAALNSVKPALAGANIKSVRTFRTLPLISATVDQSQLMDLLSDASVQSVHLVEREQRDPAFAASTNSFSGETAQGANAQLSIEVADAWADGYDGTGYTVAIIDGGINTAHPMFAGRTVGAACFSGDYGETYVNKCPSGQSPQIGVGAASNCPAGSTRCDHGTHVASVAVGNDGVNYGVARGAMLMPIDVFSEESDPDECSPSLAPCEFTDSEAVLRALDYINENVETYNIASVNLSVGGSNRDGYCDDDPRKPVIDMLRQKGVAVVISAGNSGITGQISSPACISSALGVGATNDGASVATFSNFANTLDFMAPGVSVRGASATGTGFGTRSGTSMAAPHVAGAWAVMRSAFPEGDFDEMENALKTTGISVSRVDSGVTVPKIRVARAISLLSGRDRRSLNNVVSSNTADFGESFLRFYNDTNTDGAVTVTLRDVTTGSIVGTWTSPDIAPRASRQFSVSNIESSATPFATSNTEAATRTYLNLEIESAFTGYMQHVVWTRSPGVFANLSSCESGYSDNTTSVLNMHASTIADYASRLRIVNTGSTPDVATLVLFNASTGEQLGSWVSPTITAGGSYEITGAELENQSLALRNAVTDGLSQYNIRMDNLAGYLQHVIQNTDIGAVIDMTPKCDLGVAANNSEISNVVQ